MAKAFVINVTNVVEDLDGDGIEDHADPDDDGDGFSDAEEIAYGSDPRDNQSVANQAPTLLDLNGSSIAENSNAGSVVGILSASDSGRQRDDHPDLRRRQRLPAQQPVHHRRQRHPQNHCDLRLRDKRHSAAHTRKSDRRAQRIHREGLSSPSDGRIRELAPRIQ